MLNKFVVVVVVFRMKVRLEEESKIITSLQTQNGDNSSSCPHLYSGELSEPLNKLGQVRSNG